MIYCLPIHFQPLSRKVAVIWESVSNRLSIPSARPKSTKPQGKYVIDREKLPSPISVATVSKQQNDNHNLPTEGAHPDDTIEMSFQMRMQEWQTKAEVNIFFKKMQV